MSLNGIVKIVIQQLVGVVGFHNDIIEIPKPISDVLRIRSEKYSAHFRIRYQKTEARNVMNQGKTLYEKTAESGITNVLDSFIRFVDFQSTSLVLSYVFRMVYMAVSDGTSHYSTYLEIDSYFYVFHGNATLQKQYLLSVIEYPTVARRSRCKTLNHARPPAPYRPSL